MRTTRPLPGLRGVVTCAALALFAAACGRGGGGWMNDTLPETVDFNTDIKPILADRCFKCHGPDDAAREAELRLDTELGPYARLAGEDSAFAVVPGRKAESVMYRRVSATDDSDRMPPPESNLSLSEREIALIGRWIDQGAVWKRHWAFIPPVRPTLASVDSFVNRRLEREGLTPADRAEPSTLLRRLTFDLTGLPPTLSELDDFLADSGSGAYEDAVDRLLASEGFGEKMASHWLDAARYADSHGYQDDLERTMWPWRDWVIHAYNTNLPYDEFGTWQLAGDLLPDATLEQILATGFSRNHMITQEGGVIEEEFRVAYVSDRTVTTGTVFLGLTLVCGQCHDHKFDPISQTDYYGLFAFFNNVPEKGVIDYQTKVPAPALSVPYEQVREQLPFIRAVAEGDTLRSMIMADMDTLTRPTYVLDRGRYDHPAEEVTAGAPAAILPFSDDLPRDRVGLAQWIFDPNNPLTARVAVNRYWSMLFGRGLVATIGDFGNQGALPTHPELLDWLAVEFVESGWNTKALLKTMVMSEVYQRSSRAGPELMASDADNTLLARGPRFRLSGEALRDQVLAAGGILVRDIGGPSVKPYQPSGLWAEKTGGGGGTLTEYVQDEGASLYRRSIYTFWKRTVPPPSMMTFDVPDRSLSAVHRQTTSTPLQSMVLMNDPQWIEAARALAYRMMDQGGDTPEARIEFAFRLMTARRPNAEETAELRDYYLEELERFGADEASASELLGVGELPHPDHHDHAEAAAFTMVASAISNLYEAITRS